MFHRGSTHTQRGLLGSVEFTGNIVGYASSVWIGYACSYLQNDWSWRGPLSIQCIGGAILFFGSYVAPESPRYLVDTDQEVEGLAVIADFQGAALDDEKVLEEYKEIRDAVLADVSGRDAGGSGLTGSGLLVIAPTRRCGVGTRAESSLR